MAIFQVIFKNQTSDELQGCALEVFGSNGQRLFIDGVRPVGPRANVEFSYQNCDLVSTWRFRAAVRYSDNPDNLDLVLIDTGRIAKRKCDYEVTFSLI